MPRSITECFDPKKRYNSNIETSIIPQHESHIIHERLTYQYRVAWSHSTNLTFREVSIAFLKENLRFRSTVVFQILSSSAHVKDTLIEREAFLSYRKSDGEIDGGARVREPLLGWKLSPAISSIRLKNLVRPIRGACAEKYDDKCIEK